MSKNVYQLIAQVAEEMSRDGIAKDRNNTTQNYKFRGIDDVYNALAPVISKAGLVILPRMISRDQTERMSNKGTAIFSVVVDAEFDFVSSFDGSKHTIKTFGEAMDSADKATNKAMSAAYKYACFQTFCIPTEGDNDADATTPPDVAAKRSTPPAQIKKPLTPKSSALWERAKAAFIRDGNLKSVLEHYSMTSEDQLKLMDECKSEDIPQ